MTTWIDVAGRRFSVIDSEAHDLSIPMEFNGPQPAFFDAPAASARPYRVGDFSGEVRTGASCNCATLTLTPHCNGTHTESAGHVLSRMLSVQTLAREPLIPARLLSVEVAPASAVDRHDPIVHAGDALVTRRALARHDAIDFQGLRALVIRTYPNSAAKKSRNYASMPAPYFTADAMRWIVERDIQHLLVDLPSLDRADDGGALTCHRLFWDMAPRESSDDRVARADATVTELCYIDDAIPDGLYALSLQIAPFMMDAAPSRPLLFALSDA